MPWRYFIFSTFVLTAACGVSGYVAKSQQVEEIPQVNSPPIVDEVFPAKTLSGSSIAPGGVGGRQSQFSAVLRR